MADQMGINKQQIIKKAEDLSLYSSWDDLVELSHLKDSPHINNLK